MIKDTLVYAINGIWPMILIFSVIFSSIRVVYLIHNRRKIILYEELLSLIFVIYVMILFYLVTFQDNNYGFSNYVPFKEMFRYEFGTRLFYKNIIGNILLFLPFGLFVSSYIKRIKLRTILILTLISSLSIEFTQMMIGRVFDIDDIILNVVGGILGFLLYKLLHSISKRIPGTLKNNLFLNIVVILFIVFCIIYFSDFYDKILEVVIT